MENFELTPKEKFVEKFIDKKAKENNTIDLNAYALGIEESNAYEMFEMLKDITNYAKALTEHCGLKNHTTIIDRAEQLIKEATEI